MDADATLKEGEEGDDLREGLVFLREGVDGIIEDLRGGREEGREGWRKWQRLNDNEEERERETM